MIHCDGVVGRGEGAHTGRDRPRPVLRDRSISIEIGVERQRAGIGERERAGVGRRDWLSDRERSAVGRRQGHIAGGGDAGDSADGAHRETIDIGELHAVARARYLERHRYRNHWPRWSRSQGHCWSRPDWGRAPPRSGSVRHRWSPSTSPAHGGGGEIQGIHIVERDIVAAHDTDRVEVVGVIQRDAIGGPRRQDGRAGDGEIAAIGDGPIGGDGEPAADGGGAEIQGIHIVEGDIVAAHDTDGAEVVRVIQG